MTQLGDSFVPRFATPQDKLRFSMAIGLVSHFLSHHSATAINRDASLRKELVSLLLDVRRDFAAIRPPIVLTGAVAQVPGHVGEIAYQLASLAGALMSLRNIAQVHISRWSTLVEALQARGEEFANLSVKDGGVR